MTLQERELLQARLQIAAGQTLIDAHELEDRALELTSASKKSARTKPNFRRRRT